jgi:hypothetical protein
MDPRLRGDDKKEDNSTFYGSVNVALMVDFEKTLV